MTTYQLITGEHLDHNTLEQDELEFLTRFQADAAAQGADYFDLLRRVKGQNAFPLRGGPITAETARSPLYRIAHDIADRVGIEQGYVLRPIFSKLVALAGEDFVRRACEAAARIQPLTERAYLELGEGPEVCGSDAYIDVEDDDED